MTRVLAPSQQERAIREGPLVPVLLRLAGPVFVSMLLHTLFNLVNAFWVACLGKDELAAVTTAIFATWILGGICEMVGAGLLALVSRHWGAEERGAAVRVAAEGVTLSIVFALVLAATAHWSAPTLFRLLDTPPEVTREGTRYLHTLILGSIFLFPLVALESVLRASGDTRTPMQVGLGVILINLALDPLLIFGWGGWPGLGVNGAAIATVISHAAGLVILALRLRRASSPFRGIFGQTGRLRLATALRLLRVGGPPTVGTLLFAVVYLFLSRLTAQLGTAELAVLGVGNRLESLCFLSAQALSVATAAVVGQNLGARDLPRALAAAKRAAVLGAGFGTLMGAVFWFGGGWLFHFFGDDPDLRRLAGPYMQVLGLAQTAMGLEIVLMGAFGGAGYTRAPSWISVAISVARVPLAAWAAFHLGGGAGLMGVVWVITLTAVLRALFLYGLFRRGRWIETTV